MTLEVIIRKGDMTNEFVGYFYSAIAYMALNRPEEARSIMQRAVEDRSNLGSMALALAMTGDVSRAQAITGDLGHRFPD